MTPTEPPATPSYAGDFPDPAVVWDAATATYWAYATQHGAINVQVMMSTDLTDWSTVDDALPALPVWASPGHTWAPSVAKFGSTWVLWYTTQHTSSGRQCISVATARAPGGPFVDGSVSPAICQLAHGGSIDPDVFATDADAFLVWKSDDNAFGGRTNLWAATLDGTGTRVESTPVRILTAGSPWQAPSLEGPTMLVSDGTYYVLYGANDWNSSSAGIGYATAPAPLGPWRDRSTSGPWLHSYGAALGPSGPDVFSDATGATRLAYHAWHGYVGYPRGNRALWIGRLSLETGVPELVG